MNIPFVSIIIPVKNEGQILRQCLQSLAKLDYPRDRMEIIIADAQSTDDTVAVAHEFGCVVVTNDRKLVVSGRNTGFRHAQGEYIAFTDADCLFDPGWLKKGTAHFNDATVGGVGGKTCTPFESSPFEKAIDFLFWTADFMHSTSHRQHDQKARVVRDIPGCNCIYRSKALAQVMPVDENLLTAEDVWLNYHVRMHSYILVYDPNVIVWHHRRNSPRRFVRQMYRFAIGRLQVARKSAQLINLFHVLAGLSLPLLVVMLLTAFYWNMLIPFLCGIFVLFLFLMLKAFFRYRNCATSVYVPVMLVLFCVGWSAGFVRELIFPMHDVRGR